VLGRSVDEGVVLEVDFEEEDWRPADAISVVPAYQAKASVATGITPTTPVGMPIAKSVEPVPPG
jgi:hypothetical protein